MIAPVSNLSVRPARKLKPAATPPHPIDAEVGKRIRFRRIERGMTQTELADAIGVAFQQVQKYEKGINRVSASRLTMIAAVLQVPVASFFGEVGGAGSSPLDLLADDIAIKLLIAFSAIEDKRQRVAVLQIVESLSPAAAGSTIPHPPRPADGASAPVAQLPSLPAHALERGGGRR